MNDFFVVLASVFVIAIVVVAARFTRDIQAACQRLDSLNSQVIETACGPIEFAQVGEGYPVLGL